MRNVHKKEFDFLRLPEEALTEDRGYSFCSEPYLALADPLDSIQWKNDVFGVAGLFDSMVVELERQDGTLETALGAAVSMPKQSNAVGFIIDWRTNLITYGPGCYRVKVNWDIQGITGLYYAGNFELLPYTLEASEGTVQLIVNYDDKVLQDGINYTGSGFYTGLRFKGFFGNEQINSEHRNLLKANNVRQKVRNFSAPSYDLVTRPLTRCFTRPLKRMLLNASDIWISDYNAWNHEIYRYFNVILSDAAGIDFEGDETFVRQINATLLDKLWTTESKYDLKEAQPPQLTELFSFVCPSTCSDGIVENSDGSYTDTVASGGTLVLPDTTINITDQLGNPLDTITFPVYSTVNIDIDSYCTPCPPAVTRSTATLMKTGQTTSYRTGDDGDLQEGRATDFLTLDAAPVHDDGSPTINTTTNRFTDTAGGQTYANNIVLDWSTWNGATLLGVQTNLALTGNITWNNAIDYCLAFTLGGFAGWRMWNYKEFVNLIDIEKTAHFNFPPWNNVNVYQYWLSSTTTTDGFVASSIYGNIGRASRTGASGRAFPVRTFSLSTSNVLT